MEQEQRLSNVHLACWFREVCNKENCSECQSRGLWYLAYSIYIERTLIPLGYRYKNFIDLELNPAAMGVSKYLKNIDKMVEEGNGFYAYGQGTGTGKTTVGCIALIYYLYYSLKKDPYDIDNRRVLYLNTTEFLDRMRKSFNNPDEDLDQLIEELTTIETAPRLILFDDIGAEKSSEWVNERLYSLINFREANGLASIYTGNLDPGKLENRLGKRVASRIQRNKAIYFTGSDRREPSW